MAELGEAVGHRLALAQGGAVDPLDGRGDSVRQGRVDDALLAALRVRVHGGALATVKRAVSCNNTVFIKTHGRARTSEQGHRGLCN